MKKKASRRKTKSPEKLPYEKSEEESKAGAQRDLYNWRESVNRSIELRRNPPKPQYISRHELRNFINVRETKQREVRKPSPLSDYERSLEK